MEHMILKNRAKWKVRSSSKKYRIFVLLLFERFIVVFLSHNNPVLRFCSIFYRTKFNYIFRKVLSKLLSFFDYFRLYLLKFLIQSNLTVIILQKLQKSKNNTIFNSIFLSPYLPSKTLSKIFLYSAQIFYSNHCQLFSRFLQTSTFVNPILRFFQATYVAEDTPVRGEISLWNQVLVNTPAL